MKLWVRLAIAVLMAIFMTMLLLMHIIYDPVRAKEPTKIQSTTLEVRPNPKANIRVTNIKELVAPKIDPVKQAVVKIPKKTSKESAMSPDKALVKSYVEEMASTKYGWTGEQWLALDFILTKESGWRPEALNKSSGACSMFQAYPCSKIPGDWKKLENQVPWGLNYIKQRYGSPIAARSFWNQKGWY
jgi:hypothetical protein